MPNYDYQCDTCESQFEIFQSIHDEAIQDCPNCNEPKLRRLISGAGLIFKGSGFYVNDSKGTNQKKAPVKDEHKNPEKNNSSNNSSSDSSSSQTSEKPKTTAKSSES